MQKNNKRVKIAVVGAGSWGRNLVRVFSELGVLNIICDSDENTLNQAGKVYPQAKLLNSYAGVIKDPDIGAVVLATPAETHYRLAREALLAGKDVFVEKPMSIKVDNGRHLVKLASQKKKILMVGHILQYHPAVIKLKSLIKEGQLGKIQYIYSNRLNIGKLRQEENILWSFAPHDISALLMLVGEYPKEVSSFGGKYLQKDIYDTSLTTLDFTSGIKAHIFVSWLHPFKEQKLVVVGSRKMAVFDDLTKEKLFLYPHTIAWNGHIPFAQKAERQIVGFNMAEPLKQECRHFLDCISIRRQPRTDALEGLRVLRILASAEESLKKDKRVVLKDCL